MIRKCERPSMLKRRKKINPRGKRKKALSLAEHEFSVREVIREAKRCLGLRACESCEICSLFCPDLCITRNEAGAVQIDLSYCKGCGICAAVCPKGAIQMVLDREG